MKPLISIIIPAFNVEAHIAESIRSAQNQSFQDLEIIVIDDNSTDETSRVAEGFAGDPRVTVLQNSLGNRGPSGARNTGIEAAQGRYLGFLDADDIWHQTKAEKHLEWMELHPDCDLTFSRWSTMDEHGRETGRITRRPRQNRFQLEDLLKENFVGGASNVICRKHAINAVGCFDASLQAAVDLDLWLRIACLRKANIHFIDEVLTCYRLRAGQITKDWQRMARNWEIVVAKMRARMPERVQRVENEARAKHLRYRAYLAYEAGDFPASRQLLWQAFACLAPPLLADGRTWITAAAVLGSFLPASMHLALAKGAKALRARLAPKVAVPPVRHALR